MRSRILSIRIGDAPPLSGTLELEPADMNLVYGHNEKGKTLIVEAVLRCLFPSGPWALRSWDNYAEVQVQGPDGQREMFRLDDQNSLADLWDLDGGPLPGILPRLMVVKGGALKLSEAPGGVGADYLRRVFSNEELIGAILGNINSKTIQKARLEDGRIAAERRGEEANRQEHLSELKAIEELIDLIDSEGIGNQIGGIDLELGRIERALERQRDARRFEAGRRNERVAELEAEIGRLPDERQLTEIATHMAQLSDIREDMADKSSERDELVKSSADVEWLENALKGYSESVSAAKGGSWPLAAAASSLAAAAALAILGRAYLSLALMLLAGGLGYLHYRSLSHSDAEKALSADLERLESEYRRRFGRQMGGRADLQTHLDEQRRMRHKAQMLEEDLARSRARADDLLASLRELLDISPGEEEDLEAWHSMYTGQRDRRRALSSELAEVRSSRDTLGIPPEEYLGEDPGETYDPALQRQLENREMELRQKRSEIEENLAGLKSRISERTGVPAARSWEELLDALRERRMLVEEKYLSSAATMIAGIAVVEELKDLREKQDKFLRRELSSTDIGDRILELTGRYESMELDGDSLVVIDSDGRRFELGALSTSAREQVLLAVRTGLLQRLTGGERSFMILDDAFQHSDWERRERLVSHVFELVEQGWQVFYLTMDDHLRDLFYTRAEQLGERFCAIELD